MCRPSICFVEKWSTRQGLKISMSQQYSDVIFSLSENYRRLRTHFYIFILSCMLGYMLLSYIFHKIGKEYNKNIK